MRKEMMDGVFVVLEGIDGAGTTTQAERYAAYLRSHRRLVHVTREPSGGPIGSQLRLMLTRRISLSMTNQAETMALLFAADRLDHVETDVEPHLRDGAVVISDRFDLSSLVYQAISAEAPVRESMIPDPPTSVPSSRSRTPAAMVNWIREINRFARRPDVTVVLDVSPEVAANRRRLRGGAVELYDDHDLQARLAACYRRCDDLVPGDRVLHIDGDRDADTVAADIVEALTPFVSSKSTLR